ncbi:MAG: hypothetical protein KJ970_06530 [Candidatus Eisenbacteria bacterium]|uniref:Uncharacterized protein n=1 Tax=Eiseniibacteriota bacterium TaxID=2212470 RepID=A0A948RVZ1_UNCEI|nr:hypothetical protein [Candidatus Eisenbacteria bacterium]MBU1948238.1 hypothetical protein [Candidatus Eisenbacteria bacterium]MBU2690568.1 hypothetical protein [Candidatus Eisenbacteria bacterium]
MRSYTIFRRNLIPSLILCAVVTAAIFSNGCEVDSGVGRPNLPPQTNIFVKQDTLNPLNYQQVIHWWGSDTDGFVAAFLYKWSAPWTPAPEDTLWTEDSTWVWTQATSDTFLLPVEGSYRRLTFEVMAIDNEDLTDPTPATQVFTALNNPPTVEWSRGWVLPTRSLPATSFAWSPEDPEGRNTVAYALLWLEPDSAGTVQRVERDTVASVLPEQFKVDGVPLYGERTMKLQVFDEAATGSNVLEHTWTVDGPSGPILLIDNVSAWVPGYTTEDNFYRNILESIAPGLVHVLDVERDGGFRAGAEVFPLFSLFDAVIWYSGPAVESNDASMKENLEKAEKGLAEYLQWGGHLYLSATNLFGTNGGLTNSSFRELTGSDTLYTHIYNEAVTTNITLPSPNYPILLNPDVLNPTADPIISPPDTLTMQQRAVNVEFFSSPPEENRLLWLAPATLDTSDIHQQAYAEFHCGIRRQVSEGRLVLMTFPLSRASRLGNHVAVGTALLEWLLEP